MAKGRLEAFSDGVIAIILTIMALEMKVPRGGDFKALQPVLPVLLSYVLSFVFIGIYWNNHHHMLHATREINGRIAVAFVRPWISDLLYALVAILWFIPDPRIEKAVASRGG